ncbi:MAG: hypothetical protein NT062_07660 [Proteobacteria bacterium]|nr:hypothetical protein [Pseudomonadota bacterium]
MKHVVLLTSLLFGACVGSEIPGPPAGPDAAVKIYEDAPPPPPDMGPAAGCVDRALTPPTAFIHPTSGTSRAGESCTNAGCHNYSQTGGVAPPFVFGGTLYKPGTAEPDVGATIMIYPVGGAPIALVTDTEGNFYGQAKLGGGGSVLEGGTTSALPATAAATVCPTLTKGHLTNKIMTGTSPGVAGNCNACHDGSTQSLLHN